MSFREALVNWRDPEFDRMNARGYQATIKAWARENGATSDSEAEALILEAEDYVIRFDTEGSPGEIIFNRGEKLRSRGDFEGAIDEYAKIAEDDGFCELARIQTGYCLLKLKKLRDSRGVFDDYLTQRVTDPKYKPNSPIEEARRKGAVSRAEFYRAFIDTCGAEQVQEVRRCGRERLHARDRGAEGLRLDARRRRSTRDQGPGHARQRLCEVG